MLTRAGNDRRQVEPVRGTIARVVLFKSGYTPLEEPDSAGAVPAGGMRETDTNLGETLPQVALFARTSLPAGLEDLMRSKGPTFSHQIPSQVQGLRRWQWLLRNRLDAGRPVGQRPAKSITRSLLTWATGSVAVPIAGHCWLQPECSRTIPNAIHPMVGVGSPNVEGGEVNFFLASPDAMPAPGGDDDETQARHVASRAELLPEERAAGSDDPQAKVILEESEEHTEHPDLDASSPSRRESPRED